MTVTAAGRQTLRAGWPEALLVGSPEEQDVVTVHTECGRAFVVDAARWHAPADGADRSVIEHCLGPVLDIGSGPGRMGRALAAAGIAALGIDVSSAAVARAVAAGSNAVVVDVFGDVPRAGRWATALLLDGNVGIGGDPVRLLSRVAELVVPSGRVVVEVDPPRSGAERVVRRIRVAHGAAEGDWFDWALVRADQLAAHAVDAGWFLEHTWVEEGRWFGRLTGPGARR